MINPEPSHRGWNLFARVLQEILAAHGCRLGQLDDRAQVHPERVRRLRRSLLVPKSFPILTHEEMERVIEAFNLNWNEQIRLRAALLATSIEATLMDRINQDEALMAAEQIFPIIERALQEHEGELGGLALARKGSFTVTGEDTDIDRKLGKALAYIDHAIMSLHLSHSAGDKIERVAHAKKARDGFESALLSLNKAELSLRTSEAWLMWHDDAQSGLTAAKRRLAVLGR